MIKNIQINGFKSIVSQSVELGRLNVLIGANGSGKSNFLEAIGIASAASYGSIDDESLQRRGVRPGVPRFYKSSFSHHRTAPHITLDVKSEDAEYKIFLLNPLDKPNPMWFYKTERLISRDRAIVKEGIRHKSNLNKEKGLAALKLVELNREDPAPSKNVLTFPNGL